MDHDSDSSGNPDEQPGIDPSSQEATRSTAGEPARSAARPESIGPYKILSVLGEGGMGVVDRAE